MRKTIDLQLFADAVRGKKIVYLYRLKKDAAKNAATALAFTTENGRTTSKDADTTETKDGTIRTPGAAEVQITATSVLAKGDTLIDSLEDAMINDELVEIFGAKFACVDKGFGNNKPVDVVIRPEDIDLLKPEEGTLQGVVTHLIFKGVHYEMEVTTPDGFEWLVHSTDMFPVGQQVGLHVDPFDIQIMNKPASEDEEALGVNE